MASSSSATQTTTLNRQHLYRQSLQILNANSLHFIPISLLFLPLTYSAYLLLQFYYYSDVTLLPLKTLISVLAVPLFVILPTIAAIALITYSADQSIYRKPLTFSSTVKSLSHSYIPLLSTVVAGSIKLLFISLFFALSPIIITTSVEALGFHSDRFILSIFLNTITSCVLPLTVLFLLVIWGSAASIAVLELKSGFEPLRQSANQSTEFRSHSFSIIYISAYLSGTTLFLSAMVNKNIESSTKWISILQVGVGCLQSSLVILLHVVANTVLYVQCKVARGEEISKMAGELEGEGSGKYVSVAVDDEYDEVPHEPAKDVSHGGFSYMINFLSAVFLVLSVPLLYTFSTRISQTSII